MCVGVGAVGMWCCCGAVVVYGPDAPFANVSTTYSNAGDASLALSALTSTVVTETGSLVTGSSDALVVMWRRQ